MEPLDLVEKLFTVAKAIKDQIDKVQSNKEKIIMLQKHIDSVLTAAGKFKAKAQNNDDLKKFVTEMDSILQDTKTLVEKLSEKPGLIGKLKKVWKAGEAEEEIHKLRDRLDLLSGAASFLALCKLYEDDQIKVVKEGKLDSWVVPFDYVCLFCHLTPDGLILIGGSYKDKENARQIRAYNQEGTEQWHWQCSSDIGQASDITTITAKGVSGASEHHLAIVSEDTGKIVLFHPKTHSVIKDPAYTVSDPNMSRLRKITTWSPDSHRVVVSVDPTWTAADAGGMSELKVLNCAKMPFTEMRTIKLERVIDTHSITNINHGLVAVACGRHEDKIWVCDLDQGHPVWHLQSTKINDSEITPEAVCGLSGDICVYDSSVRRLVMASSSSRGWKDEILHTDELGDQVYGLTWDAKLRRIIVLHDKQEERRVTLFKTET